MALYDNTQVSQLLADARDAMYLIGNRSERDRIFNRSRVSSEQLNIAYALYKAVVFGVAKGFNDSTFYRICAYLRHKIDLIGPAVVQGLRILTHPSSVTVNEGAGATFTVVAISPNVPLNYQWRKNGNNIVGANSSSYTINVTSVSDSGSYDCVVTDSAGNSLTSNAAALVVNAAFLVLVEYGWSLTDPYPVISGGDPFTYAVSTSISPGANISMNIPLAQADGYYFVTKIAASEPLKTLWYNTALNQGTIPDAVYQSAFTSGSFRYYITRVPMSVDTSVPLILS